MKKQLLGLVLVCFFCILTGCQKKDSIEGIYDAIWNEGIYYEFEDGTYKTNDDDFLENYLEGTYKLEENKVTLNPTENHSSTIGYLYNEYIGNKYVGNLPLSAGKEIVVIQEGSDTIGGKYHFQNNEFKYIYFENGSETIVGQGTYEIENNKIICKSTDGLEYILFIEDDFIFEPSYIKR